MVFADRDLWYIPREKLEELMRSRIKGIIDYFGVPECSFSIVEGICFQGCFLFSVIDDVRALWVMSVKKETRSCGLIRRMISSFV